MRSAAFGERSPSVCWRRISRTLLIRKSCRDQIKFPSNVPQKELLVHQQSSSSTRILLARERNCRRGFACEFLVHQFAFFCSAAPWRSKIRPKINHTRCEIKNYRSRRGEKKSASAQHRRQFTIMIATIFFGYSTGDEDLMACEL